MSFAFVAIGSLGDAMPLAVVAVELFALTGFAVHFLSHREHGPRLAFLVHRFDVLCFIPFDQSVILSLADLSASSQAGHELDILFFALKSIEPRLSLVAFNLFSAHTYHVAEALDIRCAVVSPSVAPPMSQSQKDEHWACFCSSHPELAGALSVRDSNPGHERIGGDTIVSAPDLPGTEYVAHWMLPLFAEHYTGWRQSHGLGTLEESLLNKGATCSSSPSIPTDKFSELRARAAAWASGANYTELLTTPETGPATRRSCFRCECPILYGISEKLYPRPSDWPTSAKSVGFFHQDDYWRSSEPITGDEVLDFLFVSGVEGKCLIVVVDLGSVPSLASEACGVADLADISTESRQHEELSEIERACGALYTTIGPATYRFCSTAGCSARLLFLTHGRIGPRLHGCIEAAVGSFNGTGSEETSRFRSMHANLDMHHASFFHKLSGDHDSALCKFQACLVHHGGAGTTGSACRSALPQIIVPFAFDQHLWAERICDLGLGAVIDVERLQTHRRSEGAEDVLGEALKCVTSQEMRRAARGFATQLEEPLQKTVSSGPTCPSAAIMTAQLLSDEAEKEQPESTLGFPDQLN